MQNLVRLLPLWMGEPGPCLEGQTCLYRLVKSLILVDQIPVFTGWRALIVNRRRCAPQLPCGHGSSSFLPFRAFCVEGPQNLMFVRPSSVVCRLSSVVYTQRRLSCTLGTLRDTILCLSAPQFLSKIHEKVDLT